MEDVRVFFLKKNTIIWGVIMLVVVIALIILLRIAAGHKEVYNEMIAILGTM